MGTRDLNELIPPVNAEECPKSVADAHNEYKTFKKLK